jgi:hypothetical protein
VSGGEGVLPGGQGRRILAFLAGGSAVGRPNAAGDLITLDRSGMVCVPLSARLFADLAKAGWILRKGREVQLSPKAAQLLADCGVANSEGEGDRDASRRIDCVTEVLTEGGVRRTVRRVKAESPVDLLAARPGKDGSAWLAAGEHAAAERLRADFTRAQMLPGIGMRWTFEPSTQRGTGGAGGNAEMTDGAIAARGRVNAALEAVGPEFAGLLIDVCCHLKGMELVEAERGWPRRSAKLMLKAGLSILARHYAPPSRRVQGIRHWGAADYRPAL